MVFGSPGGAGGVLLFFVMLYPILIILILGKLQLFRGARLSARLFSYIGIIIVTLLAFYLFVMSLRENSIPFIAFFMPYLGLLLICVYIFNPVIDWRLKDKRVLFGILSLDGAVLLFLLTYQPAYVNEDFEKEISGVLGVELISRDSLYNARRILIKGDTVAGYYEGDYKGDGSGDLVADGYFFRSLSTKFHTGLMWTGWGNQLPSSLGFENGTLYPGYDKVIRIYPDGTETEEAVDMGKDHITVNNLQVSDDVVIFNLHNRVVIYDQRTKRKLLDRKGRAANTLLDGHLLFTTDTGKTVLLNYYNLSSRTMVWSEPIKYYPSGRPEFHRRYQDADFNNNIIAIHAVNGIYFLNRQNGKVRHAFKTRQRSKNSAMVDDKFYYISDGTRLRCFDPRTGKWKWLILDNSELCGIYKNFIVAVTTKNPNWYTIIDKNSGKIVARIRQTDWQEGIRFIGDKVLITNEETTGIYR